MRPEPLYASPNALAPHYRRSRVAERLLLTGHSHQAWPDVGFEAQQQAWLDAAEHLDAKWERAFAMADRVRRGFARLLDDPQGTIALGANTHELVVRWLSALRLGRRPRLVTTTAEFHTIRRQLDRLAEEGIAVVKVDFLLRVLGHVFACDLSGRIPAVERTGIHAAVLIGNILNCKVVVLSENSIHLDSQRAPESSHHQVRCLRSCTYS